MTDVANPEQMLFTSTAQAFLEKEVPLSRVRQLHADGIAFDTGWWSRAAWNWVGPACWYPRNSVVAARQVTASPTCALLAEQAGRTVAPGPLHPVSTVLAGLVEAPGGHEELIESLVSGEAVASWAAYEPNRPFGALQSPPVWPPQPPAPDPAIRIDGVKDRVEAGDQSDTVLVVAVCDGEIRQFVVPTDAPGVTVTPQNSVDLVKRYARLVFDGVEVGESAAVGTAEQTPDDHRTAAPGGPAAAVRRNRRNPRRGAHDDQSVAGRSAQFRPPAGLVPGPQASRRRHEDVVRSCAGHHPPAPSPRWPNVHRRRRSSSASRKPMWPSVLR